jgi:predicted signal transduction protein with EAL and GGDEF domain
VPVIVDGRSSPTASIGIALASERDSAAMALLRDAGAALHRAKENGADSWALVDDEVRRRAVDRFDIEHQLRSGLARGELRLHLQPIVDVTDAHIVGREALVRWQHPERGLLGPAWFLPVAEESGLIDELGRWVLAEAARIAEATPELGYVAVNVSPSQVRRPGLTQDIESILRRTGLHPSHLVIELTESVMLGAATEGRRQLTELDRLGVRLVVDDFGTGFSALSHLRDLAVSGIKVDRSFTSGLGLDPQCDRIVEALPPRARTRR